MPQAPDVRTDPDRRPAEDGAEAAVVLARRELARVAASPADWRRAVGALHGGAEAGYGDLLPGASQRLLDLLLVIEADREAAPQRPAGGAAA